MPATPWLARLKARQFQLSRKILHSWIKPTVLGCNAEQLGLEANDEVCYALNFQSLADLLVIDQACEAAGLPKPSEPMVDSQEKHAFFFLGRPEGAWGRKSRRQRSGRMTRLLQIQAKQSRPIKIVPVALFWGHQPDRENAWLKLLFSENWRATTRFKKLLAIIFHSKHILVQFGNALDLTTITASEADSEKQTRKLMRILRVHFTQQKQAILGPDISHRRTLIQSMLNSEAVREAVAKEARSHHGNAADNLPAVEKRALAYANEIAAHQSYRVIRFFHALLTWLWNKLYDGIEINNINQVKDLARDNEIVYIPCHRSHIDYLLLSYVLYHNGLTPPHIAAGKNLNLPVVGPLLRRAGAFFMRRSFQGDGLYKAVFDEYMHLMFTRGYSVEYFIEGGRSRTGRSLNPRTGMLSMTMRSFQRDSTKPICFMPVYFGYEKILEDTTYLDELAGAAKKDESILDIFRVLRTLKNAFGKVTVNFGEPLQLRAFLDRELAGWEIPEQTPSGEFTQACAQLAIRLAQAINAAVAINPVNLVATALLSTPRQNIEENRLVSHINTLVTVARETAFSSHMSVTSLDATAIIHEAERVAGIRRKTETFGQILSAPAPLPVLLTYYRNNTIHVFALPSLIARLAQQYQSSTALQAACGILYPFLRAEFFLRWPQTELPAVISRCLEVLRDLNLVQLDGDQVTCPKVTSEAYANLQELGGIIAPTLERYYIINELLAQSAHLSLREVESNAALIGQQLSIFYGMNTPEFFDKSLFSTLVATLKSQDIIQTAQQAVTLAPSFKTYKLAVQATLGDELKINVQQLVHRHLATSAPAALLL